MFFKACAEVLKPGDPRRQLLSFLDVFLEKQPMFGVDF
jgi:hypothetical protein